MLTWRDAQTLETRPPVGLLCCVFPDYVKRRGNLSEVTTYKIHKTKAPMVPTVPYQLKPVVVKRAQVEICCFQTEDIILLVAVLGQ